MRSRNGRSAVCLQNAGPGRAAVYGNADAAARTSTARRDGRPLHVDLSFVFERAPRLLSSELPDVLDRAALFRISGSGRGSTWSWRRCCSSSRRRCSCARSGRPSESPAD